MKTVYVYTITDSLWGVQWHERQQPSGTVLSLNLTMCLCIVPYTSPRHVRFWLCVDSLSVEDDVNYHQLVGSCGLIV